MQDFTGTSPTSRTNVTLTVPTGIVVNALFKTVVQGSSGGYILYTTLFENDQAPGTLMADLAMAGTGFTAGNFARLTNTSAQIAHRATASTGTETMNTYGWIDTRGK
jgi:hypothetical protein